jgi:O-antigen/teichoic acid export membrane protein
VAIAPNLSPYRLANVRAAIGHYLLGRGASAVIGFATIILLVRVMDVTAYAGYIAMMGLAGIGSMLSSLGLERTAARFVPEGRLYHSERALMAFAWKVVFARFVAASLVSLLFAVNWSWLSALFDFVEIDHLPWSLAIFLLASSVFSVLSTVIQALVRQKSLTRIIVLIWGGRLLAIAYMSNQQGGLELEQALWLMAISELVGMAALLVAVDKALSHGNWIESPGSSPAVPHWPQWKETRRLAGHAYTFDLLAAVPQGYFMRTLVAATLPVDVVAAYGFFSSLIDKMRAYLPIQLMYNLFEPVLVARYLEDNDEGALSRHIALMYKANLLVVMMAIVFLATSGQEAVALATAGKFVEQTWILILLLVQVALGSHVLAIQLVVNVLKRNYILSQAGAIALVIMVCFVAMVYGAYQPLLLFAVLVYSVTTNAVALWLLSRCKAVYRPPVKELIILVVLSIPLVLVVDMAAKEFQLTSTVASVLVLGVVAGMVLALLSVMFRYASEQEFELVKHVIKPVRKS